MKKVLSLIIITILMQVNIAHSAVTVEEVRLMTQYILDSNDPIQATFTNLTDKQIQSDMDKAILIGNVKVSKVTKNKVRVSISWHTLTNPSGEKQALKPKMFSRFKMKVNESGRNFIDAGTKIKAKGDMKKVIKNYGAIGSGDGQASGSLAGGDYVGTTAKTAAAIQPMIPPSSSGSGSYGSGSTPTPQVSSGNATTTTTRAVACQLQVDLTNLIAFKQEKIETVDSNGQVTKTSTCKPVGLPIKITKTYGCQSAGSLNEFYELNVVVDGQQQQIQACTEDTTRPIQSAVQEVCPNRLDSVGMKLFTQEKTVTRDGLGKVINQTACVDVGQAMIVTKEYNQVCNPFLDFKQNIAFDKFRYTAQVGGQVVEAGNLGCIKDTARSYPITETTNGCSIRDDLPLNFSIEQTKLVYIDGNQAQQTVRKCQDSTNPAFKYPHKFSTVGCNVIADPVTGRNIPQEKIFYLNNSGIRADISACKITGKTVGEELCQGQFQHNFITGQSIQMVKTFIQDATGAITFKDTVCSPSSRITYKHATRGCGYTNHDISRQSELKTEIIIDTSSEPASTAGIVVAGACKNTGQLIPYLPGVKSWVKASTTIIPNIVSISDAQNNTTSPAVCGTTAVMQSLLNNLSVFPSGIPINAKFSKDLGACSNIHGTRRINRFRDLGATCTTNCNGSLVNYTHRTEYKRSDGSIYLFDDPLQSIFGANTAGGATMKPAP